MGELTIKDHFGGDEMMFISELDIDYDTISISIESGSYSPLSITLNQHDMVEIIDHLSELITKIEEK